MSYFKYCDFIPTMKSSKVATAILLVIFSKLAEGHLRPIVGILTQQVPKQLRESYPEHKDGSYIAASYVKFVESGGARVVPILIRQDEKYYENIMKKINGVLLPGGSAKFDASEEGYATAGEIIYKIAKKFNDNNDFFPMWGTCLGFELFTYLSANKKEHRVSCESNQQALQLDFKKDFMTSKLFKNAPSDVISILRDETVTSNFHKYCVTESKMAEFDLNKEWRVLSTNKDFNGLNFVSAIESKKYPFFGVQFHPEKNVFEWVKNKEITRTTKAMKANKYFSSFFAELTRKNDHKYDNEDEEMDALIYNYQPTYTAKSGSLFQQCYFFD